MEDIKYFQPYEFIFSSKALKHKLDNTVHDPVIMSHIFEMIEYLTPLRKAWGSPIMVFSGYRCKELNDLVGGSKTSAHLIGYAADLVPKNGKMKEFKEFVREWFKYRTDFDQVITESAGYSEWVHVGLYNLQGKQRRQLFEIKN